MDPFDTRPIGTVTFLFTDIEGSTKLLERLGTSGYSAVLERHQRIIREALGRAGGSEIKTEGDSFFVVFRSALSALEAVVDAQRRLVAEAWPDGVRIRVRMGLHTGEGTVAAGSDYVGLDVHRAARVAAAGHGGQVLVSATTRALIEGGLPDGVSLRDLGEHRLKDLARADHISQLVIEGLPDGFPPLKTLDATPNNLPIVPTSFVGRMSEVAAARRLLDTTRLLTLTGPGGTGKTRLALQLAVESIEAFPGGVFFVPLEPITEPALVASTIAQALGVQDVGGEPTEARLATFLSERRLLLVLDNFEQVTGAAGLVSDLIKAAPDLRIVVTSRAILHVYGEQEYPVPPLGVPDPANLPPWETLAQFEAVALFIARAMAARPDFRVTNENAPAVAQITARLDGLPLAIELAAARIKLLSPQAMLPRLESRLALLGGGGSRDLPARQQTLRGAIAWSFDLLDDPGRCLFARLSTFQGGFDLDAAEAICGPSTAGRGALDVLSGLSELADQSLIRQADQDEHVRFAMLETIREFAAEKLSESGEMPEMRRRHALHFAELAERVAPHLVGEDRATWLDLMEHEHDNIRAAIGWAVETGEADIGLRLVFATWRFWQSRAFLSEGQMRTDSVLAATGVGADPLLVARGHEAAGGLAYWRGDLATSEDHYAQALVIARRIGDRRLIADELYNGSFAAIFERSDVDSRVAALEEARGIYRELGDENGLVNALWALGGGYYFLEEWEKSIETQKEVLDGAWRIGNAFMAAWALHMLGSAEAHSGRRAEAVGHLSDALRAMVAAGETTGIVLGLDEFGELAYAVDDHARSQRLYGAARALQEVTGAGLASVARSSWPERQPEDFGDYTPEDIERFRAEGRALSKEQAVELALGLSIPSAPEA